MLPSVRRNAKRGTKSELERARDLWVRLGLRNPGFPVEDMACGGCMPGKEYAHTKLGACVSAKALENCGLCAEYTCGLIRDAFDASEALRRRATKVCIQDEMALLEKAFFSKCEYFDRVHQEHRETA